MEQGRPSRTAVFVCQGRAVAHGRIGVGRFEDPVAERLLRGDEILLVEAARERQRPSEWRDRMAVESVLACAEVVAPRTVAIDDAVREAAHAQVVILGAGLDSRPWRLRALSRAVVFYVDHPATLAVTRERVGALETVAARLEFVPVDLAKDALAPSLRAAGLDAASPTTWVWEGVVPYLDTASVETTIDAVASLSASGSVLVVNYQTRSWRARGGRVLSTVLSRTTGLDPVTAGEPWRSLWAPREFEIALAKHGFQVVADTDLLTVAHQSGMPTRRRGSLANGRVAVSTRS